MAKSSGIAQFSNGRSDIHRVDPHLLHIRPNWNAREEGPELDAHIDMLAQSIAEIGVKEPITVKLEDGKMYVTNGHCRQRAAMRAIEVYKADLKTVPVQSEGQYVSEADMILSQIVRNSGKPLTILEQGKVYKKLLDLGWQQSEIAKKVGLSSGRISQILDFQTMPEPVKAMVNAGHLSASLASSTVKEHPDPQKATETLARAVSEAQSEGRKVKPKDVGSSRYSIKMAFDNSDIDCSEECVNDGVVHITMPYEDWLQVQRILGL